MFFSFVWRVNFVWWFLLESTMETQTVNITVQGTGKHFTTQIWNVSYFCASLMGKMQHDTDRKYPDVWRKSTLADDAWCTRFSSSFMFIIYLYVLVKLHTQFKCGHYWLSLSAPYCVPPVWRLKHPTFVSQTLSDSVLCRWSCVAQLVLHCNNLAKVRGSIQWDYTHTRKMQLLHRKAL